MRKNALARSIATLIGGLGLATVACADVIPGTGGAAISDLLLANATATTLVVNNGGIGHSLITPYFNAQNGNATIISVTNTDTVNGKVMKVRFRGASNSDDILDFTVLMSPGDIWNATVSAPTADSPAQIVTNDRTCTLPQLAPGVAQPFVTNRLTTKGGSNLANNTREGYIEIFNMADIPSDAIYGGSQSALFTAIKHVDGVAPCTSGVINTAILNTNYVVADEAVVAGRGLQTPTTGLFGNWVIINVPQTTTYSGEMVAIRAVDAAGADARGNFVVFPQSSAGYPTANIDNVTADPLLRNVSFATLSSAGVTGGPTATPAIAAAMYDMPDMSTPYVTGVTPLQQAALLTSALSVNNVMNEYATDAIISAKTDWVFSMPTRRYSVAMNYAPATPGRLFSLVLEPGGTEPYFHSENTSVSTTNSSQICVTATGQAFFDREERTKSAGAVFSPGSVSITQFCGEVSVLSFADAGASVLGASVARQDTGASAYVNGWGNVNVLNGTTGLGLPILGASFIKATNPVAGAGFAGTYGFTSEHRFTR